ncbi:MAG: motif family protein [Acidobacteriota bacterium]|jgi:Spy/CpxP family protein refolding chaperone|nr:motif family protein [Acidobacteriota bacterium]
MTPRAKTRLKIWLVVVGVFVLGGVTGASLDSLYRLRASGNGRAEMRGERRNKEDIFERMKNDLNLTDQQATEIHAILDQARNDYRQLRTEVRPRYDAARQNARTKIRALLTPEQQQKFDAKVAEYDAKRDREDK